MKKMNNKGFSLVELIVVVLIMAIIAVALAPQVMKWVENSRISTDATNYESMIENLQLAIADKEAYKKISADSGSVTVEISTSATKIGSQTAAVTSYSAATDTSEKCIAGAMTNIDASWFKIAKKASGTVSGTNAAGTAVTGQDKYEILITLGKQANVKRTGLSPETLKNGTDLS